VFQVRVVIFTSVTQAYQLHLLRGAVFEQNDRSKSELNFM